MTTRSEVSVCIYVCAYVHMCILGVWYTGKQEVDIECLLNHSPPYFWRWGLSLNLELAHLARLAGQKRPRDPPACVSPVLGWQRCTAIPGLHWGRWGMDSGPHTCIARTSLIAIFTALHVLIKLLFSIGPAQALIGNQRRIFLKRFWFYWVWQTPLRVTWHTFRIWSAHCISSFLPLLHCFFSIVLIKSELHTCSRDCSRVF